MKAAGNIVVAGPGANVSINGGLETHDETPTNLSFVRVTSADSASEFKADSGKFYLFIDESTSSFSFDKFVSAGDIAFDVTMKNSTGKSIVLLGIGIKVLKVSEVAMMPSGQWQTFKINTLNAM